MLLACPAKLNLHLRVAPLSPPGTQNAGYHHLASWMVLTSLHDDLSLVPRFTPGVTLTCQWHDESAPHSQVPTDDRNLVLVAARALAEHLPDSARDSLPGVALHLTKRIPPGTGLGGGSSDAASTIYALDRFWQLGLPTEVLLDVAAKVGSDVPFFLHCLTTGTHSAWCTGRGELVSPISLPRPRTALLIFPPLHCSTPDVYRHFDQLKLGTDLSSITRPPLGLPAIPLLSQLQNDLQPAAFGLYPRLAEIHAIAQRSLDSAKTLQLIHLTGSGSALFTLFDTPQDAAVAQQKLPKELPSTLVTLGQSRQNPL